MVSIADLAMSQSFLSPIPIISYVMLQCCILIAGFSETEGAESKYISSASSDI